ncbi:MAG: DNA-3-methyladenine glycosylase I [Pseudomonadota bacterium]
MQPFKEIYALAAARHGGGAALEAQLPAVKSQAALRKTGDDRWLAAMTRAIFCVGFAWKVVDAKWPGFEEAFEGFDPARIALYGPDQLDRLIADKRIIRNGQKILAVQQNAVFLRDLAGEHGTAARFFADWPHTDIIGLWAVMKARGARLGGVTAPLALRWMEKDTPILSGDVVKALVREGVIDKAPTSKKALATVQQAFNAWAAEARRPLAHISRILAMSVG